MSSRLTGIQINRNDCDHYCDRYCDRFNTFYVEQKIPAPHLTTFVPLGSTLKVRNSFLYIRVCFKIVTVCKEFRNFT